MKRKWTCPNPSETWAQSAAACSPAAADADPGAHRCSARPRAVRRPAPVAPPSFGWRPPTARTPAPTAQACARTGPDRPSVGETQARTVDVYSASLPPPSASLSLCPRKRGNPSARACRRTARRPRAFCSMRRSRVSLYGSWKAHEVQTVPRRGWAGVRKAGGVSV